MKLCVKNLSFSYRRLSVLKNISLNLESESYVCVLGKNGVGKSTLFKCILGILKGSSGEILLDGKNIRALSGKKLASSIAYIPQMHSTAFAFSVLDMVIMGTTATFSPFSTPKKAQRETAYKALAALGMESFSDRSYDCLSGGEQQMVLIARALAQNARILLMDEPCASLDYGNQIRVMEKLKELSQSGYLIIQSTHNPEHAFLFADQVLILDDQTVTAFGPPDRVLTETALESIYQIPLRLHEIPGTSMRICVPKA